ncbi:MAG: MBL fold metallo-hydrolase [Clostridia bacterium]|nr:MBL fold metallo-hydrolase [Clostridia bacterium]
MKRKQAEEIIKSVNETGKNIKSTKGKILYILLLLIVAVAVVLGGAFLGLWDNLADPDATDPEASVSTCKVHYIDVGQGDCELVECDGKYMLIDASENGHENEIINYLKTLGVEKLDYVVVSHQHSDHIGGIPEVLAEFEADNIIMPRLTKSQTPTNSTYKAFLNALKSSEAKITEAKVGAKYNLGTATFEILGPVTNDAEDINNMSAVVRLDFGENSFLFTGDAETEEELEMLDNGANLDCDVLKAGHHGSSTSSCNKFLDAVTPEICVISCGEGNDYGHPHDKAVNRIKKHTDDVFRTDLCGDIVIVSDGKTLSVSYENSMR